MYHGRQDMIVQTAFGKMSFEYLKSVCQLKNIQFKLADVPQWMNIGHGTTEEEMNDVAKFIGQWLPSKFDLILEKKNDENKNKDKNKNKDIDKPDTDKDKDQKSDEK